MFVAYWTADHDALKSIFSDPGKFYVADPYAFLFASLVVLIFGAGTFSIDWLIGKSSFNRCWVVKIGVREANHNSK